MFGCHLVVCGGRSDRDSSTTDIDGDIAARYRSLCERKGRIKAHSVFKSLSHGRVCR